MTEQAPKPEKKHNEMVPAYIFDKTWQEGNFLIPVDKEMREELRQKLEYYSRYGVMWLPENEKTRSVLLSRIVAIEAYDTEYFKAKKISK